MFFFLERQNGRLTETEHPVPEAPLDDLRQADERAAADEQNVACVDLDELLLRVLAAAVGRNVRDRPLEHFQKGLLDPLARNVARDRNVMRRAPDFVDLIDVEDPTLRRLDVEIGRHEELQQKIFHVLTDVTRLGERRGVADGKRNVQDLRQRLRQQGFARAGRTDEQNVRLAEFYLDR